MIKAVKQEKTDDDTGTIQPDIIEAAYLGDAALVQKLLIAGADVNAVDPRDNLSCLHIAGLHGDRVLADVILAWNKAHGGVDFSIRSRFRPRLAWQFAINATHPDLALSIQSASLGISPIPL